MSHITILTYIFAFAIIIPFVVGCVILGIAFLMSLFEQDYSIMRLKNGGTKASFGLGGYMYRNKEFKLHRYEGPAMSNGWLSIQPKQYWVNGEQYSKRQHKAIFQSKLGRIFWD